MGGLMASPAAAKRAKTVALALIQLASLQCCPELLLACLPSGAKFLGPLLSDGDCAVKIVHRLVSRQGRPHLLLPHARSLVARTIQHELK